MKKLIYLLVILLINTTVANAITEDDKAAIRASINETYRNVYYSPEHEARSRVKHYIDDTYFYEYIKCKNNCEIEWDFVRAKTRSNSMAKETFDSCMANNCNYIKEVQVQECYDYVDQYIELKNKNKKK